MSRRPPPVVIAPFLACVLAACPDKVADTADGGEGPPVSYCEAYARLICARLAECGLADPGALGACESLEARTCDRNVDRYVRAGAREWRGGALDACRSALAEVECVASPTLWRQACLYEADVASAMPRERCARDEDCIGGYCRRGGQSGTCEACVAYSQIGEPCSYCDPSTSFCRTSADGGAACEALLPDGAPCTIDGQCASGICNRAGACGGAPVGTACLHSGECVPEAYCKGSEPEPTTPGVCTARFAMGAACQQEEWDPWGGCPRDAGWCLDGRCVAPAPHSQPVGSDCRSWDQCVEGAICVADHPYTAGECHSAPADGAPCVDDWRCSFDQSCVEVSGVRTCMDLRRAGESCEWGACRRGLVCIGGTCQPYEANGSSCEVAEECLSGRCIDGACSEGRAAGAQCEDGSECESGGCSFDDTTGVDTCTEVCFP